MRRIFLSAVLVIAGSLGLAVPTASAAGIFLYWDADFTGTGLFGPTFRLENGSFEDYADFFVDLHLDDSSVLSSPFLTETGPDADGVLATTGLIGAGLSVQTTTDFSGLTILNAFLRWSHGTVVLVDLELNRLDDGLTFENSFAEVQLTAAPPPPPNPVPEPGTLLLLGTGAAAAFMSRRRSKT